MGEGGALQYGDGEWGTTRWGWEGGTTRWGWKGGTTRWGWVLPVDTEFE